ncbi:MAG: EFR1 family ferrodoxin [Treponema sp.]|nr:EFR1 family ferrodoxin [Treponema sp.]
MIYYFSGTGNSKYVAEQLAKYTDDTARFIPEVFDEIETDIVIDDGSPVGVVFPVYAWQPPAIVMEFLSHVHVSKKSFTYAVATCGSDAGKAFKVLASVFQCNSAYSVTMPENYVVLFNVDEPARVEEKLNVAEQRIPQIAAEICAHREIYDVEEGREAAFKTYLLNPLFSLFLMRASLFSVDSSCIGCGACETNCPFGTITLVAHKPVWEGKCQMCMSCISKCPVHAIQCGSSRKRGRYVFPEEARNAARTYGLHAHAAQANAVQQPSQKMQVSGQKETAAQKIVETGTAAFSLVEIVKSPFFKMADASELQNVYVARRTDDEMHDGIIVKTLGDMRQIAESSVSYKEIHLEQNSAYAFSQNAEYVSYAVKGSATLLHRDAAEVPFPAAAVAHFSGGTVCSVVNKSSSEFVMLVVEAL